MLKKPEVEQQELEWVSIASLVPDWHLLRKIESAVDFIDPALKSVTYAASATSFGPK